MVADRLQKLTDVLVVQPVEHPAPLAPRRHEAQLCG
jgi:hypothetical protein